LTSYNHRRPYIPALLKMLLKVIALCSVLTGLVLAYSDIVWSEVVITCLFFQVL